MRHDLRILLLVAAYTLLFTSTISLSTSDNHTKMATIESRLGSPVALVPPRVLRGVYNSPYTRSSINSMHDAIDNDESCLRSPIQSNVTLKGGIEAGYFRKLAEHVAMQLCVELCCEEKGCDVAIMSGKNCYGVQCFSSELCRSLPAKKRTRDPVLIAHVTFSGEQAQNNENVLPSKLECSTTRMRSGVTLRGGLQAGNFTDVGTVGDMPACVRLCCVSEKCDVAMMINQHCFLVACFAKHLCEMVTALTNSYRPSLAYVLRTAQTLFPEQETSIRDLNPENNQLTCKNSQMFYNSTLKAGYKAGNYTNFGKVANMSACVRLCCGSKDCDAALMLENNCFAVACFTADDCLPVRAKSSGSLAALNPRLTYITSRSEEVTSSKQLTIDGACHPGVISYDVSLKGGMNAGNFTPHGKVGSMEACIERCCRSPNCSLAMMLNEACFTVACKDEQLCEKKPTSSKYKPRISYVVRDSRGSHFKQDEKSLPHLANQKSSKNVSIKPKMQLSSFVHPKDDPREAGQIATLEVASMLHLPADSQALLEDSSTMNSSNLMTSPFYEFLYNYQTPSASLPVAIATSDTRVDKNSSIPKPIKLMSDVSPVNRTLSQSTLHASSSRYLSANVTLHTPIRDDASHVELNKEYSTIDAKDTPWRIAGHGSSENNTQSADGAEYPVPPNATSNKVLVEESIANSTASRLDTHHRLPVMHRHKALPSVSHTAAGSNTSALVLQPTGISDNLPDSVFNAQPKVPNTLERSKSSYTPLFLSDSPQTGDNMTLSIDSGIRNNISHSVLQVRHFVINSRRKKHLRLIKSRYYPHRQFKHSASMRPCKHNTTASQGCTSCKQSALRRPKSSSKALKTSHRNESQEGPLPEVQVKSNHHSLSLVQNGSVSIKHGKRKDGFFNVSLAQDPTPDMTNSALLETLREIDVQSDSTNPENNRNHDRNTAEVNMLLSDLSQHDSPCSQLTSPSSCSDPSTVPSQSSKVKLKLAEFPVTPGSDLAGEYPTCTDSEILYNVTFKGGISSGKFHDRGIVESMRECVDLCCLSSKCDVAFMLRNHCFSVSCKSESSCEAVKARSSVFSPVMCYVFARSYGRQKIN